jgi:hypothetical protein
MLLFFGLALIGFLRDSRAILAVAALLPISWAIIDLDYLHLL